MSALLDDGVPVSPKARSGFSPLGPLAKAPRLRVGLILVAAHSRLVLIAQEQVRLIFRALRRLVGIVAPTACDASSNVPSPRSIAIRYSRSTRWSLKL
jgi:hypothetical protein